MKQFQFWTFSVFGKKHVPSLEIHSIKAYRTGIGTTTGTVRKEVKHYNGSNVLRLII